MLSESEQRRWQEIELLLTDVKAAEPQVLAGTTRSSMLRRRAFALALVVFGVIVTITGLVLTMVPLAVAGICAVGSAGLVWTWRRPASRQDFPSGPF